MSARNALNAPLLALAAACGAPDAPVPDEIAVDDLRRGSETRGALPEGSQLP